MMSSQSTNRKSYFQKNSNLSERVARTSEKKLGPEKKGFSERKPNIADVQNIPKAVTQYFCPITDTVAVLISWL